MKKILSSFAMLMMSMVAMAQSGVRGDANGDGEVGMPDVMFIMNYILGTPAENFNEKNADANLDGVVSKPDAVYVVYYILYGKFPEGPVSDELVVSPDTVYVDADGQDFAFQLQTSVAYDYTPSASWLSYVSDIADTDSLRFSAAMNPSTSQRTGYVAFASQNGGAQKDTLWVVQYGKRDSRYIDIDWSTTTLNSYNEESGEAVLTFSGDVPVMGDYDVVLLPSDGDYTIRLIDNVQQAEDSKTVTLATREGKMGNLFKNKKFTLATSQETASNHTRAMGYAPGETVILPSKVEVLNEDGEYVELYNASTNLARGNMRQPNTSFEGSFIDQTFNDDGRVLWDGGMAGTLSWEQLNFSLGLKGVFSFDFGDIPFEKVRMGDLKNLQITLEGGFDMNLLLKYTVKGKASWEPDPWTLLKNVIPTRRITFYVGTVPVYITVGADLLAQVELGASGIATITGGAKASTTVKYGVEWDAEEGVKKIAECERNFELLGPDINIQADAHAEAKAYPKIEIGIYKVLCPTIMPAAYIRSAAHGQLVDNQYVAWDAGIETGVELGLGLSLDLFFWDYDLGEIDPINIFNFPLVQLPDNIELLNEPEEEMMLNTMKEIKYHVTNKNYITGTEYDAGAMLVHFKAEGGELEDEYGITDSDGNVSAFFTLTDANGGTVKAEVVKGGTIEDDDEGGGDEGGDEEDDNVIPADDWTAIAVQNRLVCTTPKQVFAEGATGATVSFRLERYTSKTQQWDALADKTIYFEAAGGSCSASAVTSNDGTVSAAFTPEEEFTEGSVTATVALSEPGAWQGIAKGMIYAEGYEPGGGDIADEGLKKADELDDNTYVVDEKVYDLAGEEDYAYYGKGSTGSGYNIDFCKEHPVYYTVGWGGIFNVTDEMVGKEIDYLAEKAAGNEYLYISLGTFIDPSAGWEAENNMIEFNDENLSDAKFYLTDNGDGTMTALAYMKTNDGHEGYFKLKATPSPWGEGSGARKMTRGRPDRR